VIIARALAQEAPILLLDEPTANLDIGHQVTVARLLRELAASGLAVLAAVHDLTLASLYSDRIALMSEGRIVANGVADAVLTRENLRAVYGAEVTLLRASQGRPVVVPLWEGGTD
jgi:iron complex transport system ATP-binding protein